MKFHLFIALPLFTLSIPSLAEPTPNDPLVGKTVPSAELPGSDGKTHHFPADLQGHWTVLYFYPKDQTPGCTKEACSFRDASSQFKKQGASVFGVSHDDLSSHADFQKKYHLNFPLLADTQHQLTAPLGADGGMFLSRDTFLVDPHGMIRAVWRKVDPEKSSEEALLELKALTKKN